MDNTLVEILEQLKDIKKANAITLTVPQCAEALNIREDKVRELIHKPGTDFPYFKNGSKFLINKPMLEIWVEKITQEHRAI